ncbi:unnamed protein product [Brassica oleracea var. botrytis]
MHKGCLEDHLFTNGVKCRPLSWTLRVKVALDAAKGLTFLHSDPVKVIHRDIKASKHLAGLGIQTLFRIKTVKLSVKLV